MEVGMRHYIDITQEQIDKLAKIISKKMGINKDEAKNIIYEEYDLLEELLNSCKKIKDVTTKFITEINAIYKIV
jgi:DNA-binding transcriptional regulator GbsR (MarR family)